MFATSYTQVSLFFLRILLAAICLTSPIFAADVFPPPGFKEMSSEESPKRGFKIIHFKRDPEDFSSDSQIWIQPLLQPLKPRFQTQLLFAHCNRAGWLISLDEKFIAINYHAGSTDGLLHVFWLEDDGLFHERQKDLRDVTRKLMTDQLKLKGQPSLDHEYCYADCWLRDGLLLGHLSGHESGVRFLNDWYFIYDVENDRFLWDLSQINQNAFQAVKHEKQ